MPDLRPGQYKRIGRISESNPERAERVADRMNTRSSRKEKGKEIARGTGRGEALQFAKEVQNVIRRPDTPLASTPEPLFSRREEEGKSSAYEIKSRGR